MNTETYGETLSPHACNDSDVNLRDEGILVENAPEELPQIDSGPPSSLSSLDEHPESAGVSRNAEAGQPTRKRGRGADPHRDGIWTRHHALCTMAVVGDLILGGLDSVPQTPEPLKLLAPLSDMPRVLLEVCPWILQGRYLNFEGSLGLEKKGLRKCFHEWGANRAYYFYRPDERNEHPSHRAKGNLRSVYRQFYETFNEEVGARHLISEDRAREFWLSVSDRIPFKAPRPEQPHGSARETGVDVVPVVTIAPDVVV